MTEHVSITVNNVQISILYIVIKKQVIRGDQKEKQ